MAMTSKWIAGVLRCGLAAAAPLLLHGAVAFAEETVSAQEDADQRRAEYEAVARDMKLSIERLETLGTEIAGVKKDNTTITAALIQAAKTEKKLSQDIDDISGRLQELRRRETALHSSLAARRGVLAEVLGALQRMGLNPPPAILVKPEDALSSVRSAILLGAVVPELREETEVLMADMAELTRISASIADERSRLVASIGDQMAEKQRLGLLLEAKKRVQADTEIRLAEEQTRSQNLAAKATSLKDLIAALDAQSAKDRAAAEKALKAEEQRQKQDAAVAALPENNREIVSLPFQALQGQVSLPVSGTFKRRYGAKDDNGGVMQGDMLATQSGAIVTAPADGGVLYAGPFRSYGQLLILDAGGGYHVVLAGMSRISVAPGQAVLAGEPVGAMGEARVASTSARNVNGPELYVEFRKDGKPVDPAPWWTERLSGRTGNDT
jgi:septal ring factor EnvC (AmiA/AmiB activator)